jgi:hypothetical protein
MFWAGDTAQTISLGSSFRFNDLKAFLFRLEVTGMKGTVTKPLIFAVRNDERLQDCQIVRSFKRSQ